MILRDIRLRSIADAPQAFGQPLKDAQEQLAVEWHRSARQSANGDNRTWLVASRGNDIVGIIQGRKRRPTTLLLFSMWIDPSARRRGLGRRMIAELEGWALGWRATETVLWVYGGNSDAIRFYRDLGFEVVAKGKDVESGARVGALAMLRPLGIA